MIGKYINFNGFCRNLGLGMIPTEYRDSMSYYENLVWLCNFLEKEVVPNMDELTKGVNDLNAAFIELKSWTENYFDSEDFTEKINARLDEMVTDGTFEELLSTIVDARIADFTEEFESTVQRLDSDMDELETTVGGYDTRITSVEGTVSTLNNTTIPAIQGDITTINNTTIPGVQSDIDELEDKVAAQDYVNLKRMSPKKSTLKAIGHRGASTEAPENTAASYILAGRHGFWGCEGDVRECSTGEFFMMHDDSVDRMTNGTGSISQLTYSYLSGLTIDAGNKVESYPNQTIPSLYRFLEICNEYGMVAILEMKAGISHINNLYNVVKKYGMVNKTIFISFDESLLEGIKAIDSNAQCWLLGNLTQANMNKCVTNGYTGISVPIDDISEILLQQAHTLGLEVAAYVVDDNAKNQNLVNILCDYTTVDSMDYVPTLNSHMLKRVNGLKLYTEKDLRYAESGEYISGLASGFIKRANIPNITSGTDIDSCFSPNTRNRVYCTRVLPIKQNSTVSYVCDAASKFAVVSFDADGKFLGDLGWTQNGAGSGTYTETRNAGFAFLHFANADDSTVTDTDLERFSKIVKRVTI